MSKGAWSYSHYQHGTFTRVLFEAAGAGRHSQYVASLIDLLVEEQRLDSFLLTGGLSHKRSVRQQSLNHSKLTRDGR